MSGTLLADAAATALQRASADQGRARFPGQRRPGKQRRAVQARFFRIATLIVLTAIGVLAIPTQSDAQPKPTGVEVRLAGRLHEDGRIEVALQYWSNGRWSRGIFPTRRYLPVDAGDDRWLTSAPVQVTIRQSIVRFGVEHPRWDGANGPGDFELRVDGQRYRSNCGRLTLRLNKEKLALQTLDDSCVVETDLAENRLSLPLGQGRQDVRVAARRSAGGMELAVQHRADGGWSDRLIPNGASLPRNMTVDRWYYTFSVVLPAPLPAVSGPLHRDASLTVVDGQFQIEVDDRRYRSNCGVVSLRSYDDAVLVDTVDSQCVSAEALATICGPDVRSSACDIQRNHAYAWERTWLQLDGGDGITLLTWEAQDVVDAVYSDYFPVGPNPPRVVRSGEGSTHYDGMRHRIYLADWAMTLDAVLHETAHALLQSASVDDPGHGGRYIALLLSLWERYLPIIDVDAAREEARADGLQVADSVQPLPRRAQGVSPLRDLLCVYPVKSDRLCRAYTGELDSGPTESIGNRFGGRLSSLWWISATDDATGAVSTTLVRESTERSDAESVARLSISCEADDQLEVAVWWRDVSPVPAALSYRLGLGAWIETRWQTGNGTWGDDEWGLHYAHDAAAFLQTMNWQAASAEALHLQFRRDRRVHAATFDLRGLFETPVQSNLAQCGAARSLGDPDLPILDTGRYSDDLWWAASEDDEGVRTFVVQQTRIANGTDRIARLQVNCTEGEIEASFWWMVVYELDRTVTYRISGGSLTTSEWISSTGTWGGQEFMVVWPEDSRAFVAELAWAAQAGGSLGIRAHERNNPNRRYTATFDLNGLFDTPVQPNLARCGRDAD